MRRPRLTLSAIVLGTLLCVLWSPHSESLCRAQGVRTGRDTQQESERSEPRGSDAEKPSTANGGLLNWRMPTLGGKQFWTDHLWNHGWRVQQNAVTGHWRLLNPDNVRYAWGTRGACERALRAYGDRRPETEHYIVLVHGLMRSAASLEGLREDLTAQFDASYPRTEVVLFEYASTRGSMSEHTQALRELIANLPTGKRPFRISFVGHSMGNILIRHAIKDWQRQGDESTLRRLHAIVMLGPPNQGAAMARQLAKIPAYRWIVGEGGIELGPKWQEFEARLATPACPFGIVAGNTSPQNPIIGEESDFVVAVDETRLEGSADFLEVDCLHTFLMDDHQVRKSIGRFLSEGKF